MPLYDQLFEHIRREIEAEHAADSWRNVRAVVCFFPVKQRRADLLSLLDNVQRRRR